MEKADPQISLPPLEVPLKSPGDLRGIKGDLFYNYIFAADSAYFYQHSIPDTNFIQAVEKVPLKPV